MQNWAIISQSEIINMYTYSTAQIDINVSVYFAETRIKQQYVFCSGIEKIETSKNLTPPVHDFIFQ